MSDRFYAILAFTSIPVGGTQTLPHGLTLNGTLLVPDFVTPQYPGDGGLPGYMEVMGGDQPLACCRPLRLSSTASHRCSILLLGPRMSRMAPRSCV